jgi:hypothetical protein
MQYNVGDMIKMSDLTGIITKIEDGRIGDDIAGFKISTHIKHYSVFWLSNAIKKEWVYPQSDVDELFTKQN